MRYIALVVIAIVTAMATSFGIGSQHASFFESAAVIAFAVAAGYLIGEWCGIKTATELANPASPESAAANPRKKWQFSLREQMLLLVVVAFAIGMIATARNLTRPPFSPTPFVNSYETGGPVEAVCHQLGVADRVSTHGSRGRESASFQIRAQITSDPKSQSPVDGQRVLATLSSDMTRRLKECQCIVLPTDGDGSEICLDYTKGELRGDVRAYLFATSKTQYKLLLFISEYR